MEANTNTFSPVQYSSEDNRPLAALDKGASIVVVGAGAFGGWTALFLQSNGFQVTLIDAWGPGNSRSSSGDETRVIRSTYGANELYFRMNLRALELWREHEQKFRTTIFHQTGVLWFCYGQSNPIVDDSIPYANRYAVPYEHLSCAEINKRYPSIYTEDLDHAVFDPYGGYLKARESTQAVTRYFIANGGTFIQSFARPGKHEGSRLSSVILPDGNPLPADAFVFACGSWLPSYFPELRPHLSCTKQEVYYFGAPREMGAIFDTMPVWVDLDGHNFYYGIAGNALRGFKIGVDKRGALFDPTSDDRLADANVLADARRFLGHRFPALARAPLLESRVCPYENSTTGNFILDRHPQSSNVFFLGGGSGHGFKHGPAVGELTARCLAGEVNVPSLFRIFPQ